MLLLFFSIHTGAKLCAAVCVGTPAGQYPHSEVTSIAVTGTIWMWPVC